VEKKEAIRLFPKKAFGAYPNIDGFITQGVPADGKRQADVDKRWIADDKPFPNLTKAREYVRDVLQIPENAELGTEFSYQPATGWKTKTKGTKMAIRTPEEVRTQLKEAEAHLVKLQAQDQTGMAQLELTVLLDHIKKEKERISYLKRCVPASEAGMNLKVYEAQKKAEKKASDKAIIRAHNQSKTPHLDAANQALAEKRPAQVAPEPQVRVAPPKEYIPVEMTISTSGNSTVQIKCYNEHQLDSIFSMIKKHSL
jgi:hypothetical protein